MKKSHLFTLAMVAVLQTEELCDETKLSVLEALMEERKSAVWNEEREAKKEAEA